MGRRLLMTNNNMDKIIADAIAKVLYDNAEFSNVARPKPTRASTATQGAWTIEKAPKPSSATRGAWDSTNTPGGVSAHAKEVWTKDQLVDAVTKAAMTVLEFNNNKIGGPVKPSSSKIIGYDKAGAKPAANKVLSDTMVEGKTSAATQPAFNKPEDYNHKKLSASVAAQILTNVYKLNQ